jgi:pullulanase/glycogen debranching enzyme
MLRRGSPIIGVILRCLSLRHSGYSSVRSPLGPVNEFRDMLKALHRAGIEVILDVVLCTT